LVLAVVIERLCEMEAGALGFYSRLALICGKLAMAF
jgi:hypothetical protein